MNPSDLPTLRARLTELGDAVGSKPPGEAGLKAWLTALADFAISDTVDALDHWLRTKPKMPTPAEIRAILAGRLSDRIEQRARVEKGEFAAGGKRILTDANRRVARANLDRIGLLLDAARPHDPDQWWRALMNRWRAGEELEWAQMQTAKLAWERAGRPAEYAPPGYDPEREAERRAIQREADPL